MLTIEYYNNAIVIVLLHGGAASDALGEPARPGASKRLGVALNVPDANETQQAEV